MAVRVQAIVNPTVDDWVGSDLIRDVVELMREAVAVDCPGPYVLCLSADWMEILKKPYTIRDDWTGLIINKMPRIGLGARVVEIEPILSLVFTEQLPTWTMVLQQVEMKTAAIGSIHDEVT